MTARTVYGITDRRHLTADELASIYPEAAVKLPGRKADRFPPLAPPDDDHGPGVIGWLLFCAAVMLTAGTVIAIFWAAVS